MKTEINGTQVIFIERDQKPKKEKHPRVPQGPIKRKNLPSDELPQIVKIKERTPLQRLRKMAPVSDQMSRIELDHLLSEPNAANGSKPSFFDMAFRLYSQKKS